MRSGHRFVSLPTTARRMAIAVAAGLSLVVLGAAPALALTEPGVPEPVSRYMATGLVPRLANLYGPGTKGAAITFDATTKVGALHRVLAFTPDYLSGKKTDAPTEFTNNWVAPVTVGDAIAGLATVWINPSGDQPELATFDVGPTLVRALEAAPAGTMLVRDDPRQAWFATDGTTLTPLVQGTAPAGKPIGLVEYQKLLGAQPVSQGGGLNQGLLIGGIVLGLVVIGLALFVLLPTKPKKASTKQTAEETATEPDPEPVEAVAPVAPGKPAAAKAAAKPKATSAKPATKPAAANPAVAKAAAASATAAKAAAAKPTAKQEETVTSAPAKPVARKAPARKAPARKAPAKKAPAKKAATTSEAGPQPAEAE